MRKVIILILTLTAFQVCAQEFSYTPKGRVSELTVEIQNLFSDLVIEGNSTVEIKVFADDYEGRPERAEGLRPLSATGTDNTGIGLNISQSGDTVRISGTHRSANNSDYHISLPSEIKLRIDYGGFRSDDIVIKDMRNEVEIKSMVGDLVFDNVTGPIVASTISSDIDVVFTDLNQSSPTSITSISGDIDITLPQRNKASLQLSSTSGEIYTDLEFDTVINNGGNRHFRIGTSASTQLNGGGVEFAVKSVSGDIFIRKGN